MLRSATIVVLTVGAAALVVAQAPQNTRRVLLRADSPMPAYEIVLVEGTIPVGGREGLHTHPGALVAYVQSGTIRLDHDGRESVVYKAGDSVEIEANKVHEGINIGDTPAVLLATFVVEKGKPMTTQVN